MDWEKYDALILARSTTDADLARLIGCSRSAIQKRRKKLTAAPTVRGAAMPLKDFGLSHVAVDAGAKRAHIVEDCAEASDEDALIIVAHDLHASESYITSRALAAASAAKGYFPAAIDTTRGNRAQKYWYARLYIDAFII